MIYKWTWLATFGFRIWSSYSCIIDQNVQPCLLLHEFCGSFLDGLQILQVHFQETDIQRRLSRLHIGDGFVHSSFGSTCNVYPSAICSKMPRCLESDACVPCVPIYVSAQMSIGTSDQKAEWRTGQRCKVKLTSGHDRHTAIEIWNVGNLESL